MKLPYRASKGTRCVVCSRDQDDAMQGVIFEWCEEVKEGWIHVTCKEAYEAGSRWIVGLECPEVPRPLSEVPIGDRPSWDRRDTGRERSMVAPQLPDGGNP